MGDIEYSAVDFTETLKSSFIDSSIEADGRYAPRLLSNDATSASNELSNCVSFDFSVAFVTASDIHTLVAILGELKQRNIKGCILTSTYLNFNEPAALRKLLEYDNIETHIYQGDLHAKGYFFDRDGISTIIIGSSNLTQTALTCNKEWNVLFRSFSKGEMLHQAKAEFEQVWNDTCTVANSPAWIDEYEAYREEHASAVKSKRRQAFRKKAATIAKSADNACLPITPNKMQALALEALEVIHNREEPRALLVSTTGTGKTYLSALDVAATRPKRVLFVAHRQRILEASQLSFERVLGNRYTYGIYGGGHSKPQVTCAFAMVSSLCRHLEDFAPDEFDYIIIDEAHRTGAQSYQKVLDYFMPAFCLGMTATPSRTDGYDVYELFNHVIAFRITLQDALDEDLLVPFHYFGIADLAIDDQTIDDVSLFARLTSQERVRHITSKIEEYTVEKRRRKGLIFCNRNEEAGRLSEMFNELGYRTAAISGASSDEEHNAQIARLESGELEYLFSVDILNEGVDIPALNQIIMLRRTESPIVFVQQLGRGLRKCPDEDKEYALLLDFIGNYQQNYLVPIALSDDRTYNKDNLRRVVKEGSIVIPGCSTISFDRVSESYVFKALEDGEFSGARLIKNEYQQLKQILGRIPLLEDFDKNESIDPVLIFKKYGSYAAFLQKCEKDSGLDFNNSKLAMLKFISQKLASGKRREELLILKALVTSKGAVELPAPDGEADTRRMQSVTRMLCGEYSTSPQVLTVKDECEDRLRLSNAFYRALEDGTFRDQVLQMLDFGFARNERSFSSRYKDTDLVLNAKYTREEVCRLLHWEKEPNHQNIGGYFHDKKTNTFPVFINYDKDPSISITTQYEDHFVSDKTLVATSKSKRTLSSPEIQSLKNAHTNGMRCFLFMRKNTKDKDDGTEFYFLGEMHPTGEFSPFVMKGTSASAVEICLRARTAGSRGFVRLLPLRFHFERSRRQRKCKVASRQATRPQIGADTDNGGRTTGTEDSVSLLSSLKRLYNLNVGGQPRD